MSTKDRINSSYTVYYDTSTSKYWARCNTCGGTDYSDPSKAVVQQAAVNALTSGGIIYLKEMTLDGTVTYGNSILFIEDYQGARKIYSAQGKQLACPLLASDPSTTGWGTSQKGYWWFNTTSNVYKFWNGSAVQTFENTADVHNILSAKHGDTLAASIVRGDVLVGNATPKLSRLAKGTANQLLKSDGTDVSWTTMTDTIHGTRTTTGQHPDIVGGASGVLTDTQHGSRGGGLHPYKLVLSLYKSGTTYYALDKDGTIFSSNTDFATVFNAAVGAITLYGSIQFIGEQTAPLNSTLLLTDKHIRVDCNGWTIQATATLGFNTMIKYTRDGHYPSFGGIQNCTVDMNQIASIGIHVEDCWQTRHNFRVINVPTNGVGLKVNVHYSEWGCYTNDFDVEIHGRDPFVNVIPTGSIGILLDSDIGNTSTANRNYFHGSVVFCETGIKINNRNANQCTFSVDASINRLGWDISGYGHIANDAYAEANGILSSLGWTATGGSTTTLIDTTSEHLVQAKDFWIGGILYVYLGATYGWEAKTISGFNATTKTITVASAFSEAVVSGDPYYIIFQGIIRTHSSLNLSATGYVNCVTTDIGKQVKDDAVEIGILASYDNTNRQWVIAASSVIANGSAITITAGTGAGVASANSSATLDNFCVQGGYWDSYPYPYATGASCANLIYLDGSTIWLASTYNAGRDNPTPSIRFAQIHNQDWRQYADNAGLELDYAGTIEYLFNTTQFDMKNNQIKNPLNEADATLSGTPKLVKIDIDGVPYYFKVYPTKT
jgi:hypothetical protein